MQSMHMQNSAYMVEKYKWEKVMLEKLVEFTRAISAAKKKCSLSLAELVLLVLPCPTMGWF